MEAMIRELKWQALCEISRGMGEALDLDQSLARILQVLAETLSMKRATVTLIDDETQRLVIRASHGLTDAAMRRGTYREGEGITGRIFQTAEPFVCPDVSKEPLFLNRTGSRNGIHKKGIGFLGVPVVLQGEPVGVLTADRVFGLEVSYEEDVEFLGIVAALIAQLVSINRQVRVREDHLVRANKSLKAEISEKYHHFFMVGQSPSMLEVQDLLAKVAPSRASVLLLGESGTGKTLIARILHESSPRSRAPFIKLNCAALPENLLESELFGYEKGAFTGATQPKAGRIEDAEGGTLFLDEIGEIPLLLQAKLLRFLQEREFERLGSNQTRTVDVRIVAATNRDLGDAVRTGEFREDLYYRLNVFPILVPALRERKADMNLLLRHFLDKFSKEYGKRLRIEERARRALEAYEWPGNVREMENLVERLAILADGEEITWENLPPHVLTIPAPESAQDEGTLPHLKEMERREVLAALERNRWIQSRAARELGITLRQIGYRIKKFGLEDFVHQHRVQETANRARA